VQIFPSPLSAKIVENPEDIQISVPGGWMSEDGWLLNNAAGKKCFKVSLETLPGRSGKTTLAVSGACAMSRSA